MPTVLVVDDLPSDRRLIETELQARSDLSLHFAENGKDALEKLLAGLPDLLITDLQMPEMNGLELVRHVRRDYPHLPVILVTAHGSETIAVEALKEGAASYVPKSHLEQRLLATVDEVLAISRGQRTDTRLLDCLDRAKFDFTLSNDPHLIPPLVDLLQQLVGGVQLCDQAGRIRVGVALEEALTNALYHGNLEITAADMEQAKVALSQQQSFPLAEQRRQQAPYRDRKICVRAEISQDEARFVIRDAGRGFNVDAVPDPDEPGSLDQPSGRGILLMRAFMDSVVYNEAGNAVTMIKRRIPATAEEADQAAVRRAGSIFTVEEVGPTLVLTPFRNVSSFAEEQVQTELGDILARFDAAGAKNILIDFGNIVYFGSSMLEAMLILYRHAHIQSGKTAICNLSPVARQIIQIARFDELWPIHHSRTQALEALSTR